jgi:hypothetical protein
MGDNSLLRLKLRDAEVKPNRCVPIFRELSLSMIIQVGEASSPHRERMVAEFHVAHDGYIDIPAEVYEHEGKLMIAIYSREGGNPWEFPLADFIGAIGQAIAVLGR